MLPLLYPLLLLYLSCCLSVIIDGKDLIKKSCFKSITNSFYDTFILEYDSHTYIEEIGAMNHCRYDSGILKDRGISTHAPYGFFTNKHCIDTYIMSYTSDTPEVTDVSNVNLYIALFKRNYKTYPTLANIKQSNKERYLHLSLNRGLKRLYLPKSFNATRSSDYADMYVYKFLKQDYDMLRNTSASSNLYVTYDSTYGLYCLDCVIQLDLLCMNTVLSIPDSYKRPYAELDCMSLLKIDQRAINKARRLSYMGTKFDEQSTVEFDGCHGDYEADYKQVTETSLAFTLSRLLLSGTRFIPIVGPLFEANIQLALDAMSNPEKFKQSATKLGMDNGVIKSVIRQAVYYKKFILPSKLD